MIDKIAYCIVNLNTYQTIGKFYTRKGDAKAQITRMKQWISHKNTDFGIAEYTYKQCYKVEGK